MVITVSYLDLDSMFEVHSDCYWDYESMDQLLISLQ